MRALVLFVLLFFVLDTGSSLAQIKEEALDVTDSKRLVSEDMRPLVDDKYDGSHATFRAEYKQNAEGEASWTLSLYGYAEDTTGMSAANTVSVEANGQLLEAIRVESRTRDIGGTVLEIKRAVFTRPAFEQIAMADWATISVGSAATFEATRPSRKDLRLILDRVSQETPPTASSEDDSSANPPR